MDVEYEPLEPILTPEAALAPDAIQIDPEGNVIGDLHHQAGDVEAGLAEADIVLENTFTTEPVDHCFLEPPAGLAFVDPDGVLTVLVCTQYPHYHHRQVARVTGLGMDRVRVVQTVVGGAFGGKMDNTVECAISLLALETGRPVRMIYTRDEVFTTTTKRHAMTIRQRLGATRDGRLTALDAEYLADGGAYRSYSLIVGGRCVIHTGMPYRIPNVRAHYTVTFTNHPPSGAMRSFGVVKVAFAIESQLNELADRLGMSPIELRRINGMVDGERTPIDQTLWDIGFHQTLDAIEPIYERRKRAIAAQAGDGRKRGLGIACLGYGIGYSGVRNPSTARMRVDADGVVTAFCGTPDIGTGSDMALAQIAAQTAGIDVRRVRVVSGDSTKTDDSGPTSASRTTYFSGNAACICGRDFKDQFESAVSRQLGVAREQVRLEGDRIVAGNERIGFEDACRSIAAEIGGICGYGKFDPDIEVSILTFKGNPYPSYTYASRFRRTETQFAGEYSIADIATFPWLRPHERQGQALSDFPNVERWFRAIERRPLERRSTGEHVRSEAVRGAVRAEKSHALPAQLAKLYAESSFAIPQMVSSRTGGPLSTRQRQNYSRPHSLLSNFDAPSALPSRTFHLQTRGPSMLPYPLTTLLYRSPFAITAPATTVQVSPVSGCSLADGTRGICSSPLRTYAALPTRARGVGAALEAAALPTPDETRRLARR